jgi:putative ABC transport system permease protein
MPAAAGVESGTTRIVLLNDLSFALRALRRSPGFTAASVSTIALGIGASTAIFSVLNTVLLRPLPYKAPERLVVMYMDLRNRNTHGMPLSNENFVDIREGSTGSFEDFAAVRTVRQVLPAADGTPEQIRIAIVTTNFFRVVGHPIATGRDFRDADGIQQPLAPFPQEPATQAPAPIVAVLSHEYWQRRYGNSNVIGQRIPVGPRPEIVGIIAPGLQMLFPPSANVEQKPDIWVATRLTYDNANRNTFGLRPVGRLRAGASLARAQEGSTRSQPGSGRSFRSPRAPDSMPVWNRCKKRSWQRSGRRSSRSWAP